MINVYVHSIDEKIKTQLRNARLGRNPNIKFWFSSELKKAHFSTWRDAPLIDSIGNKENCSCFSWNKNNQFVENVDSNFFFLLKSIDKSDDLFVILDNSYNHKEQRILFIDAPKDSELPDKFYHVMSFDNYENLISYANEKDLVPFTLDDKSRFFRDSSVRVKGATAYVEMRTGYYWYLDTFHKDHYEVFDKLKNHLGEADMKGKIDTSKKDKDKKLDRYIS